MWRLRIGLLSLILVVSGWVVQAQDLNPEAKPVDTRQFGLLELGDTQAEVLARLGPPLLRTIQGEREVTQRNPYGSRITTRVLIEVWDYPGTRRILPVQLVFHGGRLVRKRKVF